jgi:hypothetical protein
MWLIDEIKKRLSGQDERKSITARTLRPTINSDRYFPAPAVDGNQLLARRIIKENIII